jgi:NAD(P)-dependent dehydrogenase (short-subunit alcohol dehydrogenase family)
MPSPDTLSLQHKVALVSGSSAGIGASIAQELARRGASVIINYPNSAEKPNADRVLQSLDQHSKSVAIEADLSDPKGAEILVMEAAAVFGKVDILVNNVGVMLGHPLDDPDDAKVLDAVQKMLDLNGRGTYLLTRATLKILSDKNSRIINITSGSSRTPGVGQSMYAGTKGMIESLTRSWAKELPRKYGCTVNAIAPGVVGTEGFYAAPPFVRELLKPMIDDTPVAPRVARPEEIAWVVAMLCEEGAGWVNGVYLPVGGGTTMV